MDRILFFFGMCALSFLYGAATMQYHVWPYELLKEAKLGLTAWASMDTQKSRFPNHFEDFEDGASAVPVSKTLDEKAGSEYILVSGGPYQLMDRCPTWGCMAWITDRSGKVVHSWEVNLEELWSGLKGVSGDVNRLSLYPVGMALGKDGSLAVSFQGRETYPVQIGIMKVDRNGKLLWKRFDNSHHWITSDDAGHIYTPNSTIHKDMKAVANTKVNVLCKTGQPEVDAIRVIAPDGKPVRDVPVMDAMVKAGYAGLFYGVRDGCDLTHLNSIALAPAGASKKLPRAAQGDFLISLRETNTVALLDAKTAEVKYAVTGLTAAQHGPTFLPDGSVLVFDNLGGDAKLGGSRVARLDLAKGTAETLFPRGTDKEKGLLPMHSATAGHIDVSDDGKRALVAVTHDGRIIEIDTATGAPLWAYENTQDIGKFLKANDIRAPKTRARFATYGAYYVRNIDFTKEKP